MRSTAYLAILAASLGWGLAGVGSRILFIEGTTTFTLIVLRAGIAAGVLWLYLLSTRRRISATAWRHGSIIGIVRIGIAPTLFIASLQFVSAGFEALVIALVPAATAGLAHFALDEPLTKNRVVGLGLGLVGALVLIASGDSGLAEGGNALAGGLLGVGGVVAGAVSGILARRFAPLHNTAELSGPMFVSGLAVAGIASLFFEGVHPGTVTNSGWGILIALALASTLLPFVATLYASKMLPAAQVALTGYLVTFVGVVAGVIVLDEIVTVAMAMGGLLILLGVFVAGRSRNPVPVQ